MAKRPKQTSNQYPSNPNNAFYNSIGGKADVIFRFREVRF